MATAREVKHDRRKQTTTTTRSPSADSAQSAQSKDSYDSVEVIRSNRFLLTPQEKEQCVQLLHCSKKSPEENCYRTWTSHWNRNNAVSTAAYTLMKIKRWHLIDERFLFDPMKQNTDLQNLTTGNALWVDTSEVEMPVTAVDAILNHQLSEEQVGALEHLDNLMDNVDYNSSIPLDTSEAQSLCKLLKKSRSAAIVKKFLRKAYAVFTFSLRNALRLQSKGCGTVNEKLFEKVFMSFIDCILACVDEEDRFFVDKGIFGVDLDQIVLDVELDNGLEIHLRVSSQPDVFIHEALTDCDKPATLIGVVEAKGLMNQTIVDSDDEGSDEPVFTRLAKNVKSLSLKKSKCLNQLHKRSELHTGLDQIDEEEEEEIVETDLEKLIKNAPPHLERITELPPHAQKGLKKFLPQLIGEMWCCSKTTNVRWFYSVNGLKFGIGLVGFDVYFVTMMDSSVRFSEPDAVMNNAEYTNVFVTRPFRLLSKKDRRIIIKTLVAALFLDDISW